MDRFYLVIPFKEESHVNIFHLGHGPPPVCIDVLREYWIQSHYLTRVWSYLYKDGDRYKEVLYMKNQLVSFCKEINYVGKVVPSERGVKKQLKKVHSYSLGGGNQIKWGKKENIR